MTKRRRFVRVSLALLLGYAMVVMAVLGCGLTDRLLLFPQTGALADTGGATRLALSGEQGEIEVWRARSRHAAESEPKVYVLRFYGNADRADRWVASEAHALPFSAELWGVNYPGFGGSTGPASLRGVAASATIAFDEIKKRAGARPILVVGTSIGTTAALHVAATREVSALVLQNPPPLRELIVGDYGWWNLWLLAYPISRAVPAELDSLANASRAQAPAVFILAAEDDVVGHRYQLAVRDSYLGPKRTFVIPGAKHNDPIPADIRSAVDEELRRMVGAHL